VGAVPETSEASGDDTIHPFAAAFMTTGMPMLITDARQSDNPIVFANEAFTELTGYRREELLGRNCRMLQGPGTDSDLIEAMRHAVRAGEAIELEILNYRKDGRPFWNALHISPVRDSAGSISHFFSSQHDVTAKKDLERGCSRPTAHWKPRSKGAPGRCRERSRRRSCCSTRSITG
jgi:PAS domain S-box-containing protein